MKTAQSVQYRRLVFLGCFLSVAFVGLGFRLIDLQVLRHDELLEVARQNTQKRIVREPRRGDIRDIRGNLLATSKAVKTVCVDPSLIGTNNVRVAQIVAPILGMDVNELADKLQPRSFVQKGATNIDKYVVLKRKVEDEDWEKLKIAVASLTFAPDEKKLPKKAQIAYQRLRNRAFFTEPDQVRVYPNGSLASHILGYSGMEEKSTPRGPVLETSGKDGLELTLNKMLRGVEGWRQTETDSSRRELVQLREQDVAAKPGLNAVLTVDASLQHILETELADVMTKHTPLSVSGMMVRPKTGEILAMATFPNYDPNHPGDYPAENRKNRIISNISEPGSTFKIVVISGALNDGLISPNDMFHCEFGRFVYAGKTLRDHESYGLLTVEGIITKSSNIGSAKVGLKMGEERLYQYMRSFGFGTKTGIPLTGEVNGIIHPVNHWNKLSITRIPMGHEVAVTPMQMVMAMCAIANGGVLMKPMLVDRLEDENNRTVAKYQPQAVRRVISETAARQMVHALKTVVATNGTGLKAKLDYYTVAGKTGTAQKPGKGGYLPGKYFSSFIGFFPADNPEICISIVLDEPKKGYYGGEVAGPVFKRIGERAANYLAIPPENTPVINGLQTAGR